MGYDYNAASPQFPPFENENLVKVFDFILRSLP